MHRRLIEILTLVIFLGFNNFVLADLQTDLIVCSDIKSTSDRLDCYDTVANHYKTSPNTSLPSTQPNTKKLAGKNDELKINSINEPTPPSEPSSSAEDRFGQFGKDGLESIQSHIVGSFTGWKKGLKLTLKNGQVWKVTNNKTSYKKLENPKITITHGVFGSFNAKVEGLNARAKVKRIK